MPLRKTYMLKNYQRMMKHVMIGTNRVLTEFTSTSSGNLNIKGTFSTANPDIMAALEASPDFNKEYYLYHEERVNEPVKESIQFRANPLDVKKFREEQEKNAGLSESELADNLSEGKEPDPPEAIQVKIEESKVEPLVEDIPSDEVLVPASEISNFQAAKKYLKDKFPDLKNDDLKNKEKVLQAANDKGIKFEALL